eukprot:g3114.t1
MRSAILSRVARHQIRSARASVPSTKIGAVRYLNLHEYQSKDVMEMFNVRVQKGKMAATAEEALEVAKWIKKDNPDAELILKAQIHAGGRGKGHFKNTGLKGGVQICDTPEEVESYAKKMLGDVLVTHQTGDEGQLCQKVLINEGITIDSEFYFAILMDRAVDGPCIVASSKGGMDIEAVAEEDPDAIITSPINIETGLSVEQSESVAKELGFEGETVARAAEQMRNLYALFDGTDATQVEINPFAVGGIPGGEQGLVMCVDAKLNFDDNAAFRQKNIYDMRDVSMEDPRDVRAEEVGLNYIGLDGSIGCMVNGAGLAMATMDIIKMKGGDPANFLDVGGGATQEQVAEALKLIKSDPQVKAILVNIFGGIMKCDVIASGIVEAVKEVKLDIPLVVRLEGTNVDMGKKILEESTVDIITADDLDDAAEKIVATI